VGKKKVFLKDRRPKLSNSASQNETFSEVKEKVTKKFFYNEDLKKFFLN